MEQPKLTDEQEAEFRQAFNLFDLDGGGDISVKELGTVMRSLGQNPSDADVAAMIAEVDDDGSGAIEFEEFAILMARKIQITDAPQELAEAFRVFDEAESGFISVASGRRIIAALAAHMTAEEVDEVVKIAEDGDGRISYHNFCALMTMRHEQTTEVDHCDL